MDISVEGGGPCALIFQHLDISLHQRHLLEHLTVLLYYRPEFLCSWHTIVKWMSDVKKCTTFVSITQEREVASKKNYRFRISLSLDLCFYKEFYLNRKFCSIVAGSPCRFFYGFFAERGLIKIGPWMSTYLFNLHINLLDKN